MNNLKIKINGTEISLENSTPVAGKLASDTSEAENLCASLSKESDTLSKQIKAISLLSDVKSVESFGYKSTEAVGENIKTAFSTAGGKVKEFIDKIITAIKNFIGKKVVEVQIAAADKRMHGAAKHNADKVIIRAKKFEEFEAKKAAVLEAVKEINSMDLPAQFMGVANAIKEVETSVKELSLMKGPFTKTGDDEAEISTGDMINLINNAKQNMNSLIGGLKKAAGACEMAKKTIAGSDGNQTALKIANLTAKAASKATSVIIAYTSAVATWKFPAVPEEKPAA